LTVLAQRSDPARLISRIALALSLAVGLGLPVLFLVEEFEEFQDDLQADADAVARAASRVVSEQPGQWKALAPAVLGRSDFRHLANRRLVDGDGRILGSNGEAPARPTYTASAPVVDAGRPVAQAVVERSLLDLGDDVGIAALLGLVLGVALYAAARTWPLRILRRTLRELEVAGRAFENTADCVVIYDAAWRIASVNQAFVRTTGYAADEIVGTTPETLRSKEQGEDFYAAIRREVLEKGTWRGEMMRRKKDGELFPALGTMSAVLDEHGEILHFVSVFNDVSSFREYERRLEHLAHYDPLTGLPNRVLFLTKLSDALIRARRHRKFLAVLFVDLDQFKTVNDSLGHHAGDELLRAIAKRLVACVRASDAIARQGGDEFTIIMEDLGRTEDAGKVAEKLLEALAQPVQVGAHELTVSGSIGISCYPQDGEDGETLLKNADAAMYQAKDKGRNNYQFFSADIHARAHEILVMKNNLRLALQRGEFTLHYQPRYHLGSGAITGVEALVRWQHPELGMIAPGKFIGLAEDTGMIVQLGEWVLQTACAQMKRWQALAPQRMRMAVNVSPRQFRTPDLAQRIASILRAAQLPGSLLEIEITEGVLMQDQQTSENTLHELKSMGICVAIDDFGSGYSSLSYLKRFPVDYLKIDRVFVAHIQDSAADVAIVQAVIALARGLGLVTIAEGVELEEQRKVLVLLGCAEGQGFLFSRPRPAAELEPLLAARPAAP
jgi:diguanylate cyclase (GGDEF)-like protein/PAS domain S-box-containing protein